MKLLRTCSLLLLLHVYFLLPAQTFRFGKIPREQWEITSCAFEPEAEALILHDDESIKIESETSYYHGYELVPELYLLSIHRNRRIKILKDMDEPYLYLKIPVSCYMENSKALKSFRAVIFTGSSTRKIKLSEVSFDGDYYYLELNKPVAGTIIDIEYKIETGDLDRIPDWHFSQSYPTLNSSVMLVAPDFFHIKTESAVMDSLSVEASQIADKQIVMNSEDGPSSRSYMFNRNTTIYRRENNPSQKDNSPEWSLHFRLEDISIFNVPFTFQFVR